MKAYKGFNKDMTCRGFQYEEGKVYETERAELCECGFHACEMPLDTLNYYAPEKSVYHDVELAEPVMRKNDEDSKVCSTKIKIGARLSLRDMIKAEVEIIKTKIQATTGNWAHAATTGNSAHAATTGYGAHAATTGYGAHAATTGNSAHAATTGNWAHAATTGYGAHAATNGKNAISVALGEHGAAMAALDSWLVLAEYDNKNSLLGVNAVKVDGETIKADTWYKLENGEVVETEVED